MKKTLLKKIEATLENKKLEVLNRNNIKDRDIDTEGDETDEIQAKNIVHVHNQIMTRDRERLQRIERALTKIKNGTFGDCEECGEPIEEKRLEASPELNSCISCASLNELRDKRARGIN